jgi:hypothetical protein
MVVQNEFMAREKDDETRLHGDETRRKNRVGEPHQNEKLVVNAHKLVDTSVEEQHCTGGAGLVDEGRGSARSDKRLTPPVRLLAAHQRCPAHAHPVRRTNTIEPRLLAGRGVRKL